MAGGTLSAYTNQASQRGVARNQNNEIVMFSSNYLELYANSTDEKAYIQKKISVADSVNEGDTYRIEIMVCNYANGNSKLFSQSDITYNVQIKASGTGSEKCKVIYNNKEQAITDQGTSFENQVLTGRISSNHTYVIEIPAEAVDKVKITVKAEPDAKSASITKNQILAAVLVPCTGDATNTFHYEGKFTDAEAGGLPAEYDGFNYQISVSGGAAGATLSWNSDILEIDKYFLDKKSLTPTQLQDQKGWKTISFPMDPLNESGDYLIPFYIRDKNSISNYNWNDMNKQITFTAIQQESK